MEENKEIKGKYRDIVKATTLFGGVEVIRIIVGVIQSKIIALLLGTAGVGIQGLYINTIQMISQLTALGLRTSAVREIMVATGTADNRRIYKTVITLKRAVFFLGIIGAISTIVLSEKLSIWTFGDDTHTWSFIWIAIIIFCASISNGMGAILQGFRKLKMLAKSSVLGSISGVLITTPLYYWLGVKAIIPGLIATYVISMLFVWYYARQITIEKSDVTYKESIYECLGMVKLGFFLMSSSFLSSLFSYLVNIYLQSNGGVDDVGLYRAGFMIATHYVGLVFAAMAADYLPRLASKCDDNSHIKEVVNQQGEVAILIIAPLIVSLITFAPIIIEILYSSEFLPIVDFIVFAAVAMLFKAGSWCLSYVLLAKGRGKLFFVTEVSIGIINLVCSIIFYELYGLRGLGVAYIIVYVVYFTMHYIVDKTLFKFSFSNKFIKQFIILNILCLFMFSMYFLFEGITMYIIGGIITLLVLLYSYKELDKLIDISQFINKLSRKKSK